jgi:anaerobic nitric oxide reductase flavorubredoxin
MNKKAAMFGSYGWSGGAVRNAKQVIEPLKWELTATLEFTGYPTPEELVKAQQFGQAFADSLKGA